MDKDILRLKKHMEKAYAKTFGKRCTTTDLEDFPELKDAGGGRCFTCVAYEKLDNFILALWKGMARG